MNDISDPSLSASQNAVFKNLVELGLMFFSQENTPTTTLRPRLFPLIAGPTGAGKSFLVKKVAALLKAEYFPITYGDWMVQGARENAGGTTVFRILNKVRSNPLVIVHIDELDKIGNTGDSSWSRSLCNELWGVLDHAFPFEAWEKGEEVPSEEVAHVRQSIAHRLWIVGSGTWQDVFACPKPKTLGFAPAIDTHEVPFEERIHEAKMIPAELTARFHTDIQILSYPTSTHEIAQLLKSTGIEELAESLGETIDPATINFDKQGMRIFESIMGNLMLKKQKHSFFSDVSSLEDFTTRISDRMSEITLREKNARVLANSSSVEELLEQSMEDCPAPDDPDPSAASKASADTSEPSGSIHLKWRQGQQVPVFTALDPTKGAVRPEDLALYHIDPNPWFEDEGAQWESHSPSEAIGEREALTTNPRYMEKLESFKQYLNSHFCKNRSPVIETWLFGCYIGTEPETDLSGDCSNPDHQS